MSATPGCDTILRHESAMTVAAVHPATRMSRVRDYVELGKPRLSTLVIFTAAIGVWLSPGSIGSHCST